MIKRKKRGWKIEERKQGWFPQKFKVVLKEPQKEVKSSECKHHSKIGAGQGVTERKKSSKLGGAGVKHTKKGKIDKRGTGGGGSLRGFTDLTGNTLVT